MKGTWREDSFTRETEGYAKALEMGGRGSVSIGAPLLGNMEGPYQFTLHDIPEER